MEEPQQIENWARISVLGSGAFGVVTLWQNQSTNEQIAIKKCKWEIKSRVTDKQKQRWVNEVEIMKNFKNPNIVSYKLLPKELEIALAKYNPTRLPLLSMEYCTKGNLRHVLTQVKNICGLDEAQVRFILNDIINAVSYLHINNITHRDIKPDNIVLQKCDNQRGRDTIYKLIDLGYAKEMNDSCGSFVGTLHYLAPEILSGAHYNYSVDYWSLGILTFEIICGVLPFIPQLTPFERYKYIEKKSPEHICICQTTFGGIEYKSDLLKENQITSCFKQYIESWLKHVLQFDYKQRSKNFPNNVNVFTYLNDMLSKRIVKIFSVYTFEFYSYEINESTLVGTLKDWIARDTKVGKECQILLTNLCKFCINDNEYVVNILKEDDLNIFVFKKGCFINKQISILPKCIKFLYANCSTSFEWQNLRPIYSKTIFYLTQETKLLNSLSNAFNLLVICCKQRNEKLKEIYHGIRKNVLNLLMKIQCYAKIRNNSCDLINNTKRNNKNYGNCLMKLKRLLADCERCLLNTNRLSKKIGVYHKRQLLLDQFLDKFMKLLSNCNIQKSLDEAVIEFANCRSKTEINKNLTCVSMVKIVNNALKEKDSLLNTKTGKFKSYVSATSVALKDVDFLIDWMEKFELHVNVLSNGIDEVENEIYKILLSSSTPQKTVVTNGYSISNLTAEEVIEKNYNLRCQMEEIINTTVLLHKQCYDEATYLRESFN